VLWIRRPQCLIFSEFLANKLSSFVILLLFLFFNFSGWYLPPMTWALPTGDFWSPFASAADMAVQSVLGILCSGILFALSKLDFFSDPIVPVITTPIFSATSSSTILRRLLSRPSWEVI
jgi:hypothetical protein